MKKAIKIVAVLAILAFAAIQFVRPDRSNPHTDPSQTLFSSSPVPDDVKQILERSCSDCHSYETKYPWYSNVAPFSWLLDSHIREGREELNLSSWNTYQPQTKAHKLDEICEMVSSGEMPLPSYLIIHRDAALSSEDRAVICSWATAESQKLGK